MTGKTTGSVELDDRIVRDLKSPPDKHLRLSVINTVRRDLNYMLSRPAPLTPDQIIVLKRYCSILETGSF